jgi:hypothetical protein
MIFFEEEYNKGKENEDNHFLFLQEYFNDPTLKQTTKKFSTFDYNSDNIIIELKKRNFDFGKYEDYMIGLNKIKRAQKLNKDIYFIMLFDNGMYSYKYNADDKLNYRISGRRDRGFNEFKQYAFIPKELFIKIK